MESRTFTFTDSATGLLVRDNESNKLTLVFTKTVQSKEINFALDFQDINEFYKFADWLDETSVSLTGGI